MVMNYRKFRSSVKTWDHLLQQAAEFATSIGEERLVSISQSCDHSDAVVTVWYWDKFSRRAR